MLCHFCLDCLGKWVSLSQFKQNLLTLREMMSKKVRWETNINIFFIWLSLIKDAERSRSSSAAKDFIISDLNEKGKIIWVPSEDINKSEVKPSDYVEEKLGGKSIKQVAYKFYKESKKHGIIYFLILLPFLQFVLRL